MNEADMIRMEQIKRLHFIGIGGVGMSGIAQLCLAMGYTVTGSDLKASSMGPILEKAGATIHIGHRAENVGDAELVVISSAISAANPELQEAVRRGIPIRKRAEILGWLMSNRHGIAVAGAHGKTTTTSIISRILEAGKLDPTLVVGGEVMATQSNVRVGRSPYMVVEADESDASFLYLPARVVQVTNIDDDHLDHYKTMDRMLETYVDFINSVGPEGLAVLCVDDERIRSILPRIHVPVLTYGFSEEADVRGTDLTWQGRCWEFSVSLRGQDLGRFQIFIPGRHNVQNSVGAIGVAVSLGLGTAGIRSGLESFTGVKRRFQFIGEAQGVQVFDDYAHHPTEIRATLESARLCGPRRLVVLFQPHRYSRTQLLAADFARSFSHADMVVLLPIYGAGENVRDGVSTDLIYKDMVGEHPYVMTLTPPDPDLESMVPLIASQLEPGDWVLTIGAGDVTRMGSLILDQLRKVRIAPSDGAVEVVSGGLGLAVGS